MNRQRKLISLISFIIMTFSMISQTDAQEFIFEHADCKIRMQEKVATKDQNQSDLDTLQKQMKEELGRRNYQINPFIDNKRVLTGELYFNWSLNFTKESVYHSCVINVSLRQAKGQMPRKSDSKLYSKTVKRRVPRITFKGMERCKLAVKESFIHIPTCKKIGFYGEKK